ncbi:hypothetical protein KUV57_12600 [Epibacterium sp. DP7N7-1]|nr:hypothetical protein [Epibacterium sp. DP7N7-1]
MRKASLAGLALFSCVASLGSSLTATTQDSMKINAGETIEIDRFNICKTVQNDGGNPINVPLRSAREWGVGTGSFLKNISTMDDVIVTECSPQGNLGAFAYQKWSDEGGIPGHRFPIVNTTFHVEPGYTPPRYSGFPADHCILKNGQKPNHHLAGSWPFPSLRQPTLAQARTAAEAAISAYKPPETGWCNISFFREARDGNATDTVWYRVNAIIYAD